MFTITTIFLIELNSTMLFVMVLLFKIYYYNTYFCSFCSQLHMAHFSYNFYNIGKLTFLKDVFFGKNSNNKKVIISFSGYSRLPFPNHLSRSIRVQLGSSRRRNWDPKEGLLYAARVLQKPSHSGNHLFKKNLNLKLILESLTVFEFKF